LFKNDIPGTLDAVILVEEALEAVTTSELFDELGRDISFKNRLNRNVSFKCTGEDLEKTTPFVRPLLSVHMDS
jgi:hypothetical protein